MADDFNISPDMINNLVNMLKNSNTESSNDNSSGSSTKSEPNSGSSSNNNNNNSSSDFNFSSLDFETIMKIKSIMETLNSKDDPKSNLLYSLKPYLRKSKQDKLDQYANLLKISKVSNLFKGDFK